MWQRVRVGLGWGLSFAGVYTAFVLVVALLRGSAPFERVGTTLPKAIAAYVVAGLLGGAAFGLLLPVGRTRLGAAVLGFVIALPVMYTITIAMDPAALENTSRWVVTLGSAVILGPAGGLSLWYVNRRYERY